MERFVSKDEQPDISRTPFKYSPLQPNDDEIRLVVLHSKKSQGWFQNDFINCDVKVFKLRDNPKYAALSYV